MLTRLFSFISRAVGRRRPGGATAPPASVESPEVRIERARRLDPATLVDEPSVTAFRVLEAAWTAQMKDVEVLVVNGRLCVRTPEGAALVEGLERQPAEGFGTGGDVLLDLTGRPAPWRVLEPTVLIGGDTDESRWRDALAKIGVWRRSGLGTDLLVRFLVHEGITPAQIDDLRGLGVDPGRIVRADAAGIRRFDKLIVPSMDGPDRAVDFLRTASPPTSPIEIETDVTVATLGRFPSLAGRF